MAYQTKNCSISTDTPGRRGAAFRGFAPRNALLHYGLRAKLSKSPFFAFCAALAIEPPATRAGRSAIERYAAAKAKLDADYQARLIGLQRQLAIDLRAAIKVATRNGDLADAQALQEYLDKLVGRTYTFQIDAAKDWQPTIEVMYVSRASELAVVRSMLDTSHLTGCGTVWS